MARVRRDPELAYGPRDDIRLAHQLGYRVIAACYSLGKEFGMDPWCAIGLATGNMDGLDL